MFHTLVSLSLHPLFYTSSRVIAACWISPFLSIRCCLSDSPSCMQSFCTTTVAIALVAVVGFVVVAVSPATLMMKSNNMYGVHFLINSYEFT